MQSKGAPWWITTCLLLFLPRISTCFLQSCLGKRESSLRNTAIFDTIQFHEIAHQGITSLWREDTCGAIIIGTKSGELLQSMDNAETWTELPGYDHKPKYPVYSLAVEAIHEGENPRLGRIFAGRGDRYISVWDTKTKEYVQRLGPHTGWVQDLKYDENSQILYSIGCNCIELWDCSGRETSDGSVKHMCKLSVENSVSACTLSSDLLCLCLIDRQHLTTVSEIGKGTGGEKHLLLSAGVDGRIHSWSIHRQASLVHEGRVNAMVYSSLHQILFSVGNDGKLCASRIDPETMTIEVVSELELSGSPRLTTVAIVEETGNQEIFLLVGTTDGDLISTMTTMDTLESSITIKEGETIGVHKGAKIYAVLPLSKGQSLESESDAESQDDNTRILLVGHAKGMVKQPCRLAFQVEGC